MLTIAADQETRKIIERAHQARAEAFGNFLQKLFARKPSAAHKSAEQPA